MRGILVVSFIVFSVKIFSVEPEVLRHWADEKEFKIGCAIDHDLWNLNPNGGFMRAVHEHNMIVAGNRMKMSALQPAYFAVLYYLAGVEQSISPPTVSNIDEHYRFWPNPTSSFIQFNELPQIKQLEIIALNGSIVFSEVPKSARIDLASISSGLYVIRMLHYNGNITSSILKVKR